MGKMDDIKEQYDAMDNSKKIGAAAVLTALNPIGAVALVKTINDAVKDSVKPLTIDQIRDESSDLPNVVVVEDKMIRQKEEKFQSAIAWFKEYGDIEIMHIWDHGVKESGLDFVPHSVCKGIYYVDPSEPRRYINVNSLFQYAYNARLAELDHIAFHLGAKSYKIKVLEEEKAMDNVRGSYSDAISIKGQTMELVNAGQEEKGEYDSDKVVKGEGTIEKTFDGHREPTLPTLHWFKNDPSIREIVAQICHHKEKPLHQKLELKYSDSMVMSVEMAQKVEVAIKKIGGKIKTNLRKESKREAQSTIVFELFF